MIQRYERIKYADGTFEFVSDPNISRRPEQSVVARLDKTKYSKKIKDLISYCNAQITECIERVEIYNETREDVSKRLLLRLMKDFCVAVLLLSTLKTEGETINIQLAWGVHC